MTTKAFRPPRLTSCPGCKTKRNRLTIYATETGKRCYACLRPTPEPTTPQWMDRSAQ